MVFFSFFFFFFVKPSLYNADPINYETEYVFFVCVRVCVSQVTPILNGFVPEVIFCTPTGKMIRKKFGTRVLVCIVYIGADSNG